MQISKDNIENLTQLKKKKKKKVIPPHNQTMLQQFESVENKAITELLRI